MNVRQDTTTGNSGTDEAVQLFIPSNRQLQVSWLNSLYLEVLACVSCSIGGDSQRMLSHHQTVCITLTGQLKNFGGKVLENSAGVDGCLSTDSHVILGSVLEQSVYSSDGELQHTSS